MSAADALDVVVVGGGIHGTGIARDAARRGLRVALYERTDLGSGTSSASSKLAHGGLRYLEQLQFGLVREALRERHVMLKTAPHLVRPLPFLAPVSDDSRWSRWQLGPGLWLYDLLAGRRSIERHRWLDRARALEAEPVLDTPSLHGAYRYVDAQMDDARLCVENAIDAAENGARIHTRTEVTGLIVRGGSVVGVRVRDASGSRAEISARLVVNAAGPWYDRIASAQELARPPRLRLSRGTHVVVPPLTRGHALILTAREDERVFFVLPFKGKSLVGTTEAEHHDPDTVEPTEEEIAYLLRATSDHLHGPPLQRDQVLQSFAGVRALRASHEDDAGRVPRSAEIREDAPGLIGVLGGKYTTYRAVAERVVDAAERRLRGRTTHCTTVSAPLPGGDVPPMNDYFRVAEDLLTDKYEGLDVGLLRYLVGTYGARHTRILRLLESDPTAVERIEPGLPFTMAEVEHCVRQEFARSVEDVVHRRCYRGFLGNWTAEARDRWRLRSIAPFHAPVDPLRRRRARRRRTSSSWTRRCRASVRGARVSTQPPARKNRPTTGPNRMANRNPTSGAWVAAFSSKPITPRRSPASPRPIARDNLVPIFHTPKYRPSRLRPVRSSSWSTTSATIESRRTIAPANKPPTKAIPIGPTRLPGGNNG